MNQAEEQKETEKFMKKMGIAIETTLDEFTENMGFALIVFKIGEPGIGNYVSNAGRESMIEALRETANRLEAKQDIPPAIGGIN